MNYERELGDLYKNKFYYRSRLPLFSFEVKVGRVVGGGEV